ncbi:Crp/Fnr family transcriptional regulator [Thermodesulfobacteriota bacterium]
MSVASILKKIPIFEDLTDEDLAHLSECLIRRHFSKGQVVFHKGDEGGGLYIITQGKVKVVLPSQDGDEVILSILTEGEIIGELSLFDGHNRSASVGVLEDTEFLYLSRNDFMEFLSTRFHAVRRVLEMLTLRLRDTNDMLEGAFFLDTTSRIAWKILVLGRQFGIYEDGIIRVGVRVTQSDLASMVGATRESVNKQLKMFREHGMVTFENGYFTILDPARLARRARTSLGFFT